MTPEERTRKMLLEVVDVHSHLRVPPHSVDEILQYLAKHNVKLSRAEVVAGLGMLARGGLVEDFADGIRWRYVLTPLGSKTLTDLQAAALAEVEQEAAATDAARPVTIEAFIRVEAFDAWFLGCDWEIKVELFNHFYDSIDKYDEPVVEKA